MHIFVLAERLSCKKSPFPSNGQTHLPSVRRRAHKGSGHKLGARLTVSTQTHAQGRLHLQGV